MNWSELIERVATSSNVPRAQVHTVLSSLVDVVSNTLVEGEEVRIQGIGTLRRRWNEPKTVRSVKDNRKLRIDGRFVATFKPASQLRTRLAGTTPQTWRDPEHQAAWRLAETLVGDLALYHGAKAPKLAEDTAPAEVDRRCEEALGPLWARVRTTYAGRISTSVRESADYLASAALSKFATE